jgi:preprotein translocase subunit SecA
MAAYEQAAQLAADLDSSDDYVLSAGQTGVQLTAAGKNRLAERTAALGGVWSGMRRREELVRQALVAKHIYRRDKHYVIEDDKVVIVDEFTGRLMPDRTWRHGLHQAIEAKEALPINLPKETYARISFQRFFRLYDRLSGMSGTVAESQAEMWHIYGLPVIPIPTHRPCRRTVLPDRVFTSAGAKWAVVVDAIMRVQRTGRPVLVGTGSIHESQQLSDRLASEGVDHHLLNALQHADEARIIAEAGQKQRVTVSTNMAGRGTDIKLGDGVAQLGGLHVIATARFSARRIDRQLAGRCARQGDPGSTQAFISLQDELIENSRWALAPIIRRWFSGQDSEITGPVWRRLITSIQRRAERVAFRLRRDVLAADNWLDEQLGFAAKDI